MRTGPCATEPTHQNGWGSATARVEGVALNSYRTSDSANARARAGKLCVRCPCAVRKEREAERDCGSGALVVGALPSCPEQEEE